MSEIEKLKQQKREIEAQIRALSHKTIEAGIARIGVEHYSTGRPERWYLGLGVQYINYPYYNLHRSSYRTILNAGTKEELIEEIPNIIKDLQDLYAEVTSE